MRSGTRFLGWLDSLRADAVFGWRQIKKRKVTSAAAILSLALAIGACTSAFRLVDAMLLRPLPVSNPERLYACFHDSRRADGTPMTLDSYEYPLFRQMRAAVSDQAELIAVSSAERTDLTYGSNQELEKAYVQYVSGWMFRSFGLQPELGRLLTADDDRMPRSHPYAVLSYDYWARRFGKDPKVLGRTLRLGDDLIQVIGVSKRGFTGVEPGTMTDIFVPTMMNSGVTQADRGWIRILVQLKTGSTADIVRDRMRVPFGEFRKEMAKQLFSSADTGRIQQFLEEALMLAPASSGVSGMQRDYRRPLIALSVLVALVLLIACTNVANLMAAQATARAREMALRVSIGASRRSLVQLVLIEAAWLAFLAAAIGWLFAWWAAPFVVSRINPADNPARLLLPADWRVLGFALGLALAVTFLFGLGPALRASSFHPVTALKGGGPHSRQRLMNTLIAAQVAVCSVVLLVAALFVATFERLSNQPIGFSPERVLLLDTVAEQGRPAVFWEQLAGQLRTVPGVETVALAGWPLLKGDAIRGSVAIDGRPSTPDVAYFLDVSPGWLGAMKIPLMAGRDFRGNDSVYWNWWGTPPASAIRQGVALVNDAFAKRYFRGENPLGRYFEKAEGGSRFQIVGIVGNARYRDLREPVQPVVYVPFRWVDGAGAPESKTFGTIIVRTTVEDPATLAPALQRLVASSGLGFRLSNIQTQEDLDRSHTLRERLLAKLSGFFAIVALLLASVGLYGVLDYSVLLRRREIGIRMAIGAKSADIVKWATVDVFSMVLVGAVAGLILGIDLAQYLESLLYQVKRTDVGIVAAPLAAILGVSILAALTPALRAARTNPVTMLRAE